MPTAGFLVRSMAGSKCFGHPVGGERWCAMLYEMYLQTAGARAGPRPVEGPRGLASRTIWAGSLRKMCALSPIVGSLS